MGSALTYATMFSVLAFALLAFNTAFKKPPGEKIGDPPDGLWTINHFFFTSSWG